VAAIELVDRVEPVVKISVDVLHPKERLRITTCTMHHRKRAKPDDRVRIMPAESSGTLDATQFGCSGKVPGTSRGN